MTRLIVVAAAAIGLILFVAFGVSRLLRARTRGMSIRMQVFIALVVIVGAFAFGLGLMVIDRIEARAVRLATIRELQVGALTLRDVPAVVAERDVSEPSEVDGLLPLHLFDRVTVDGPGKRLIVEKSRRMAF